jgi:uncharacterized protein
MADIKSPCNKVCTVDPISRLCIGCGRTLAEIGSWIGLSDEERDRIMSDLPRRLSAFQKRQTNEADTT